MANLDLARGRSTVLNLTNQTGSTRSPGDVVVLSTANDESFTTSASSNYATTQIGVVDETIGIGSNGRVVVEGYARNVNVGVNTVSRGHWLYQSTSAGIGVGSAINPPIAGAFGQVLKGGTGTEPSAVIIPTLQSSGGGSSASAGSNSMAVGATNQAGVAATFSPSDHRHMGLHSITSSSSNTLQRPTVNFRAGTNVGLTATDTDGDGTLDTITIHSTGAAAGGGGGSSGYDLDTYSIDGTYGDDFTAASLGAAWTRRNYVAGDETYQAGKNATYLRIAKAGQAAGDGYFRTAPSGDWTFAMAYTPRFSASVTSYSWGLAVVDTAGTGVATCFYNAPLAPLLIQVTTYTTYGGSYVQPGATGAAPNVSIWPNGTIWHDRKCWVYLRKSGTDYYMAYSLDGEVWSPESSALAWTGTVDRVGMFDAPLGSVTSGAGTGSYVEVDWFNKIA